MMTTGEAQMQYDQMAEDVTGSRKDQSGPAVQPPPEIQKRDPAATTGGHVL